MKVLTILGTRPEFIRLSLVIPKLDKYCEHIIVHTGQNYDYKLNEVFFEELGLRKPDYFLEATGTFAEQIGTILVKLEDILLKEKPDKFLVLGDTNSSMGAIIAKRMGIKVYHCEAGNRCYDDRSPEEVNRRIIDCSSDVLMPYTQDSKDNLVKGGIDLNRIFVTGNPIKEVLDKFEILPENPDCLTEKDTGFKEDLLDHNYMLVTMHRQENVDDKDRLNKFIFAFHRLAETYKIPIIISTHPRLRQRMKDFDIDLKYFDKLLHFVEPFGFKHFLNLERFAKCVLTDSGTVMEECAIYGTPCVIIREYHERPECQEYGTCIIAGCDLTRIQTAVRYLTDNDNMCDVPDEYMQDNVSDIICKIILSK